MSTSPQGAQQDDRSGHQHRPLWFIHRGKNGLVPNSFHRLVDHMKRYQEPLPGTNRVPKAVLDREIKLGSSEDAVKQVL